jgi:hypothetical protein
MPITMNDLTISPDGADMNTLLSEWEWAMEEPLRPVLLTAMGDAFAQGESGAVYFIDMVEGGLTSERLAVHESGFVQIDKTEFDALWEARTGM